ncbi:helix-turn-helix protein [Haloactinospora alba]|uniref:Helix-turn-helix protein n=1 Tax=Haloactinospora alba TaxID=405555 RepID=A0A543N7L5_9ACTN|nr:helix-turn-helix transcriptional regulator [Haloactinospora alba]TQN27819.1 helix-turn-helix protein [Haloactinospora alba]
MAVHVNPAWKRFGAETKRRRAASGLTQTMLQGKAGISASMLSAIENGSRAPKRDHAELLDVALSTGGALVRLWLDINDSVDVPEWWRDIGLLEREAVELREYQMTLIPGLLQTRDYAHTAMRLGRRWDPADTIERDVEARLARWNTLRADAVLWFVVDEYAFTRVVRDIQLMREQLDQVLGLVDSGSVELQVIPQPRPMHPGMSGPLRLLDFVGRSPVALAEHLVGEEVIDTPDSVRRCRTLFGALQAEALSPTESTRMIRELRKDYE